MSAFLYRVGVEIVAHGDRHKMAAVTGPTRPGQLVQAILVVAGHSHPQLGFGDPTGRDGVTSNSPAPMPGPVSTRRSSAIASPA